MNQTDTVNRHDNDGICVIYHGVDLDGKCSAAIAARRFNLGTAALFPMNYGDPIPWERLEGFRHVYMLDFSLPPSDMERLNRMLRLTWIDHHSPKIREMRERGFHASGATLLSNDRPAACLLTWRFLFQGRPEPAAVVALSRYDSWQQDDDWETSTLPFQYGMRELNHEPLSPIWDDLLADDINARAAFLDIESTGQGILSRIRDSNRRTMEGQAFWTEFDGKTALACNKCFANSDLFRDHPDIGRAEILLNFGFDARPAWRVSISPGPAAPDLNCGELATRYGGGGHPGRAGFVCTELPFPLVPAFVGEG